MNIFRSSQYINSVLLYLKLYGFIIIIGGVRDNTLSMLSDKQYIKIIQTQKFEGETYNNKHISILQKIKELSNEDKKKAKKFCNWIE